MFSSFLISFYFITFRRLDFHLQRRKRKLGRSQIRFFQWKTRKPFGSCNLMTFTKQLKARFAILKDSIKHLENEGNVKWKQMRFEILEISSNKSRLCLYSRLSRRFAASCFVPVKLWWSFFKFFFCREDFFGLSQPKEWGK